ncbi:cyclopropane-fatty-acyl-phospholipid synthase family protein [uncultured Chloroflexus sp.]|uniref:SAM-dependent methyltransferase n=1 Tax=uncultured Chloroflexus sp. TaxID=214040 RepID=UPI00263503D9|nr:class I SAM-dependent methyltransferase [uncultured Chloroflexus sp.]
MTDLNHNIFWQVHRDLPREAPGSDDSTLRALSMLPALPASARILDIGCGPGAQTVALARATSGHIIAVDTHQPFLDELVHRADQAGVADRIHPLQASMFDLDFDHPFDLIWSEGAIYIIGFERGLREWRRLLKPGGLIAVTEISWLKPNLPEAARAFWDEAYPGMASVEANLTRLAAAGYRSLGHFTLPERDWWDNYYHPMAARIELLRQAYRENPEAQAALDSECAEIEVYRQYSDWYGYVFYLGQVVGT